MTLFVRSVVVLLCVVAASRLSTTAKAEITLFDDTFNVSANSNAVNFEFDMGRQSGVFSPETYFELDATADGGPFDEHTQVDNPSLADTLMMISDAPSGANTAVVSPNRNFLLPGFAIQHYHVELNPAGPGSAAASDVWAGFNFGAPQGTVFAGDSATAMLIRPDGVYSVGDNNVEVASGDVTPKGATEFYSVDFAVNLQTGAWSMDLDGAPIAAAVHGAYASAYLNLTYYSNSASTGQQIGHFDNLRVTAQQTGPTTLFADTFNVSANSNDINFEYDMGRQSGVLTPATYFEQPSTATGGTFDHHTQVDNPSLPGTLRMVSDAPAGANTAYVSPNQNFLVPGIDIQHYHVELNPAGPGHEASDDVWAGFNFGAPQGTVFFSDNEINPTGVLVRPDGGYSVFDNGTEVANGGLTPKGETEFYSIDFDVDLRSGAWSLAIDDAPIAAGIHGGFLRIGCNLVYYSSTASTGQQIGYFDNLLVRGIIPEPLALPGDFNDNGVVDAADFVIWRDLEGQIGPLLAADHTGPDEMPDGMVDELDYDLWKANFGETLAAAADSRMGATGSASANVAIPEPGSFALWTVCGIPLAIGRLVRSRPRHLY